MIIIIIRIDYIMTINIIDQHHDHYENSPNGGESHQAPPEGVKERPGAGRVVLFIIFIIVNNSE